jgi:hypothetical protein
LVVGLHLTSLLVQQSHAQRSAKENCIEKGRTNDTNSDVIDVCGDGLDHGQQPLKGQLQTVQIGDQGRLTRLGGRNALD